MDNADQSRDLVRRACAGEQQALAELFASSQGRLRRLLALRAGRVLRTSELEDVVQEAYLEAARQFPSFTWQGPDSFFRWLATVALHKLANLHRMAAAQKRDSARQVRLTGHDSTTTLTSIDPPAPGPGPRTISIGREHQEEIDRALASLSTVDREVIAMSRIQGLSLQEIAERTGKTRNAVALLLSRALRKLKVLIDER